MQFTAEVENSPSCDFDYWDIGSAYGSGFTSLVGKINTSWTYTGLNPDNTTAGTSLTEFKGPVPMAGDPHFPAETLVGVTSNNTNDITSSFSVTANSSATNDQPSFFFSGVFDASAATPANAQTVWSGAALSAFSIDASLATIVYNSDGYGDVSYTAADGDNTLFHYQYYYNIHNDIIGAGAKFGYKCGPLGVSSFSSADQIVCENNEQTAPGKILTLSVQRVPATCNDVRDTIVSEYASTTWNSTGDIPNCVEFTASARTFNFVFSRLVDPTHKGWALLRIPLMVPSYYGYGLDAWMSYIATSGSPYTQQAHTVTSAYRSPAHNKVVGGQPNSRHMWGDAADLSDNSLTEPEVDWLNQMSILAHSDFQEKSVDICKPTCDHAHADWRRHTGLYTP